MDETGPPSEPELDSDLDLAGLKARLKGRVVTPSDGDFEEVALGGQWNRLRPSRAPQVIARVVDEQDVVEAVRFANANQLKVAVRGGGHSWVSAALRAGGVMIDLTDLDQVVSIDPERRTAVSQPIVTNRELQAALNAQGLAYPTGHCPDVKLSGYLLSGGMAWNQGGWGPGCASVEAIELVTPAGELITASADENPDYFWAARGAGSGLFAVALRYHLRLYPLPRAIWASSYHYAMEQAEQVADWLGAIAGEISNRVELTLFLLHAPPELASRCQSANGKVCLITATAFADSQEEARSALEPLENCPVAEPLAQSAPEPTDFPALFALSGSMWPEARRNWVDAMFFDSTPAQLLHATGQHFIEAPSETTLMLFTIFTGPDVPAPLPDAAFSMSARIYGGPWTMWSEASEDRSNLDWHAKCVELLKPLAVGHYIGESDTVGHPEYAEGAFSPANWKRLEELREKYDADGVFFGYREGLD
ncbi:MAG: FAD-binding oxidoreductase [Solirubrobacteraceae bacterium]